MKSKYASFSGRFTPLVNDGDCVVVRQVIGTILFGDQYNQLANASGEINDMLDQQSVEPGQLLCNIDEDSVRCKAINDELISSRLARRFPKKRKSKKTGVRKVSKRTTSSSKKTSVKKTKRVSKKSGNRPSRKKK